MTIFKVAYMPNLSAKVQQELAQSFTPSMKNPMDYGAQYTIEELEQVVARCGDEKDKKVLEELGELGVEYVEIT